MWITCLFVVQKIYIKTINGGQVKTCKDRMKKEDKEEEKPNIYLLVGFVALVIAIILMMIFSQIEFPEREGGTLIIDGAVTEIEHDIIFGGTFTDWRNELHFDDGTKLWIDRECDLSGVKIGILGRYTFEKNYFKYDSAWYNFHILKGVQYFD